MLYDNEVRLHKAQISHYISNIKYILLQKKKINEHNLLDIQVANYNCLKS